MAQTVEELLAEVKRLKTAQAEHERLLLNAVLTFVGMMAIIRNKNEQ